MEEENSLIILYGENGINLTLAEIKELAENSNIPFDNKYLELGISFLMLKADDIIKEGKKIPALKGLVSESFGEAAIYKYNCCNGKL